MRGRLLLAQEYCYRVHELCGGSDCNRRGGYKLRELRCGYLQVYYCRHAVCELRGGQVRVKHGLLYLHQLRYGHHFISQIVRVQQLRRGHFQRHNWRDSMHRLLCGTVRLRRWFVQMHRLRRRQDRCDGQGLELRCLPHLCRCGLI